MKLHELFKKQVSTHFRNIIIEHSSNDESICEINEYVASEHLVKSLSEVLSIVINQNRFSNIVSVEGKLGCGKTYFLKIISYCLDQQYRDIVISKLKHSEEERYSEDWL